MLNRRIFAPFWRLFFLVGLALLAPPHAAPHVRAPDAAPRSAAWTVDPPRSQATIAPQWTPFVPYRRARSVQRCASSRGRPARTARHPAGEHAPKIASYAALEPHARRAWYCAALGALEGWALRVAQAHADPLDNPNDITQEALLAALADWQAFAPDPADPPIDAMRRWLAGILEKKRLMARRFRRTRGEVPFGIAATINPEALRHPGHAGQVEARSVLRALRAATSAERWGAWYQHAAEGRTAADIAQRAGVRASAVEWLIRAAREDFAPVLARLEEGGAA